jgi:putative membrane protein
VTAGWGQTVNIGEGLRRTHLAAERTYLAWWRTALATVAVALGVGRVLPALGGGEVTWPYVVVGAGWGLLAVGIAGYAPVRQRALRRAIDAGRFAHPHRLALGGLGATGVVLTLASVLLLIAGP